MTSGKNIILDIPIDYFTSCMHNWGCWHKRHVQERLLGLKNSLFFVVHFKHGAVVTLFDEIHRPLHFSCDLKH